MEYLLIVFINLAFFYFLNKVFIGGEYIIALIIGLFAGVQFSLLYKVLKK